MRCETPVRNSPSSARRARYVAREVLWKNSALRRVQHCGLHAAAIVAVPGVFGAPGGIVTREPVVHLVRRAVEGSAAWAASLNGVQSCGSVWACPVCAERIQAQRQSELVQAFAAADAEGLRCAFVTLTVRHDRTQPLAAVWGAVSGAWRATVSGSRQWRHDRDDFGVAGYIRLVEVTHGGNGWHVHLHSLVFFADDRGQGFSRAAEALGARMAARWRAALDRTAFLPSIERGSDARLLVSTERLAAYFTKGLYDVKTPESAAFDATSSASKRSRGKNRTPFGILAGLADPAGGMTPVRRSRDWALWHEWERVSKGKRQLVWSPGLRARLLPDVADQADDALAGADVDGHILVTIPSRAHTRLARAHAIPYLLDAAEQPDDGHAVWRILDAFGVREWVPDPPGAS